METENSDSDDCNSLMNIFLAGKMEHSLPNKEDGCLF